MTAIFDAAPEVMQMTDPASPLPQFIRATTTGLELDQDLTFQEWEAIAAGFGKAIKTAAWCIGDWMVYGERKWGKQLLLDGADFDPDKPNRIPSHVFDSAVDATGLDRQTLSKYAEVCRKIPREERREELSFGHHRVLAPLAPEDRSGWIDLLTDSESVKLPTVKRLSLSVRISKEPRLVTDSEIQARGSHAGHDNYIPHLTRLLTCLRKTVPKMDEDQRDALKQDAAALVDLLEGL